MVNSFLAHHLGPVINEFGSANGPYALQAQARRRVVAVLRQGAATPACDAYGPFALPNSLMTGPSGSSQLDLRVMPIRSEASARRKPQR